MFSPYMASLRYLSMAAGGCSTITKLCRAVGEDHASYDLLAC